MEYFVKFFINIIYINFYLHKIILKKKNEEIKIEYKNKSKKINLDSREYFQNVKLDYICIEIFDEDLIWDFYDIETNNNSFDNNLSVYVLFG